MAGEIENQRERVGEKCDAIHLTSNEKGSEKITVECNKIVCCRKCHEYGCLAVIMQYQHTVQYDEYNVRHNAAHTHLQSADNSRQ